MTWREDAACLGSDPELFFVGYGLGRGQGRVSVAATSAAFAYCSSCPVTAECLDEAMSDPRYDSGIWGGMTASRRIKLRRKVG